MLLYTTINLPWVQCDRSLRRTDWLTRTSQTVLILPDALSAPVTLWISLGALSAPQASGTPSIWTPGSVALQGRITMLIWYELLMLHSRPSSQESDFTWQRSLDPLITSRASHMERPGGVVVGIGSEVTSVLSPVELPSLASSSRVQFCVQLMVKLKSTYRSPESIECT